MRSMIEAASHARANQVEPLKIWPEFDKNNTTVPNGWELRVMPLLKGGFGGAKVNVVFVQEGGDPSMTSLGHIEVAIIGNVHSQREQLHRVLVDMLRRHREQLDGEFDVY